MKNVYGTLAPSSSANSQNRPADRPQAGVRHRRTRRWKFASSTRTRNRRWRPTTLGDDINDDLHPNFYPNEVGWQDTITVKVKYQFPLAAWSGPIAGQVRRSPAAANDKVAEAIQKHGGVYTYPLEAEATIGNEGEKSAVTYVYQYIDALPSCRLRLRRWLRFIATSAAR